MLDVTPHQTSDVLTSRIIKVASTSRTSAVAGAIAAIIREKRSAELQAIGAGAVNQATKALATARNYLLEENIDIVCIPYFMDIEINGGERTVIRFCVEVR